MGPRIHFMRMFSVADSSNLAFSLSPRWALVETESCDRFVAVEGAALNASICVGADKGTRLAWCFSHSNAPCMQTV